MKTHKLKTHVEYYQKVVSGEKDWELRLNDRNFEIGDQLILEEYDNDKKEYTGYSTSRIVTYMLKDAEHFGLMNGYCIMSFLHPNR